MARGEFAVGDRVAGRYLLERVLGSGTMGIVFLARDERPEEGHTSVAIRILLPALLGDATLVQRFFLEAAAASRLPHRGIARVLASGRARKRLTDVPYIVMELLEGETLHEVLERDGPLSPPAALTMIADVAGAIGAAHRAGIVHRDLKPANLFRSAAGWKVLDFGIAKIFDARPGGMTATGEVIGSPIYMSPEQAVGWKDVDARADVWSLGVVLFRALSGAMPYRAGSVGAVLAAAAHGEVDWSPLEARPIPIDVLSVVRRCLSPGRAERYADATELALAAHAVLDALEAEIPTTIHVVPKAEARKTVRMKISARAGALPAATSDLPLEERPPEGCPPSARGGPASEDAGRVAIAWRSGRRIEALLRAYGVSPGAAGGAAVLGVVAAATFLVFAAIVTGYVLAARR